MGRKRVEPGTMLSSVLRRGMLIYWEERTMIINSWSAQEMTINVTALDTGASSTLSYTELLNSANEPLFGNTIEDIQNKLNVRNHSDRNHHEMISEAGVPDSLIGRAQRVIDIVEAVRRALEVRQSTKGREIAATDVIREVLGKLETTVSLATYYSYQRRYDENEGNRARIAQSFQTSRRGAYKLSPILIHLIDTVFDQYYFSRRRLRLNPAEMLRKITKELIPRSGGLWIDPSKCGDILPQDLLELLLDTTRPFELVRQNAEKMALLSPVDVPKPSWFYARFAHLEELHKLENNTAAALNLGHRVQLPLELAFMDEWELRIYEERRGIRRLLLILSITIMLDAFSRTIPAFVVHIGAANLAVGLQTIHMSIFPKDFNELVGHAVQFPFGIFTGISWDNAMAHDSESYIESAKTIANGNQYPRMEFVFRPRRTPKLGTLVERFLENLAVRLRQIAPELEAFILKSMTTDLDYKADQIVNFLNRRLVEVIADYHDTLHSTIHQKPLARWNEAIDNVMGLPRIPSLTPTIEHAFMPRYPEPRQINANGEICLFGMHYLGSNRERLAMRDFAGRKIDYFLHYAYNDISRIYPFVNGREVSESALVAREMLGNDGKTLSSLSLLSHQIAHKLAWLEVNHDDWLIYAKSEGGPQVV